MFFISKIVFTSHHEVQTFLKETLETLQTIIHFLTNFTQITYMYELLGSLTDFTGDTYMYGLLGSLTDVTGDTYMCG